MGYLTIGDAKAVLAEAIGRGKLPDRELVRANLAAFEYAAGKLTFDLALKGDLPEFIVSLSSSLQIPREEFEAALLDPFPFPEDDEVAKFAQEVLAAK